MNISYEHSQAKLIMIFSSQIDYDILKPNWIMIFSLLNQINNAIA